MARNDRWLHRWHERSRALALALTLQALAALAAGAQPAARSAARLAPRLAGLGDLHYPISTRSAEAQALFDQGLRLVYAFQHGEAIRAFEEAARLDPEAPMPHWGKALALGPNLNEPMSRERELAALQAIRRGLERKGYATASESSLLDALAQRYSPREETERAQLDRRYADAMRRLAERFSADPEISTLYADALMNTMPGHYWNDDGTPASGTREAMTALEPVLALHPRHPGAHHLYIHLVEGSDNPGRGLPSAEVLGGLAPAAGHLVHMPSHIFVRVGRYADASEANERAILAGQDYSAQCRAQGFSPQGASAHYLQVLWSSATLEGRSEVAIAAAQRIAESIPIEDLRAAGPQEDLLATPLYAWARFGHWREILAAPEPAGAAFALGIWHYARGLAYRARGEVSEARRELRRLDSERRARSLEGVSIRFTPASQVLELAALVLEGEIAASQTEYKLAVRTLETAVALEDTFDYAQPPSWNHPVRQILGAVLLQAGRPVEAEAVYRADLARHRENGWSLIGLMQSLEAQGRRRQAEEVGARFERAWARADVVLESSRY